MSGSLILVAGAVIVLIALIGDIFSSDEGTFDYLP